MVPPCKKLGLGTFTLYEHEPASGEGVDAYVVDTGSTLTTSSPRVAHPEVRPFPIPLNLRTRFNGKPASNAQAWNPRSSSSQTIKFNPRYAKNTSTAPTLTDCGYQGHPTVRYMKLVAGCFADVPLDGPEFTFTHFDPLSRPQLKPIVVFQRTPSLPPPIQTTLRKDAPSCLHSNSTDQSALLYSKSPPLGSRSCMP